MGTKQEIIRFSIAGALVVTADIGIYYSLFHFLPFSVSKGISFTCAGILGYLLNKYWTFKSNRPSRAEAGRFILINFLALGINVLTNQSILNTWPGAVWPALITATAVTSLLIYICFKWWVFIDLSSSNSVFGKEKANKACRDVKGAPTKRPTLKERFIHLWRSRSSPHEIALGVAIGVFIGITPFYGFHILTALLAAFTMKHVNKVAIFLGMNISLPPTIPFITWAGYSIGRKLLASAAYPPLGWDDFRHFSYDTFFNFFYALIVGSLILGIALSVLFYFLTLWFFKRRKAAILVIGERGL